MQKIIFLSILLFSATAIAQEPITDSFTLDGAINYAIEHSPILNVNKMKLEKASIQVDESRLQYIPEIYLSGDLRSNLIIPATPVPANVFNSSASEGEIMYLKFNTKWNSAVGVNIKYELFNPEKINVVTQQQHQLRIQEYNTEITVADIREQVALAYAECIIAEEQKNLLKEDTTYYEEILNNASQLYLKERVSLSEINEAHIAYNESVASLIEAEKIWNDRKAELLYIIGMNVTAKNIESLTLQEDISTLLNKIEQKTFSSQSIINNLEVNRQQEITDLSELRLKSAMWKYAPTLSLNGYYGTNYYNNELSLFNNIFWRGNSYIGLSLIVPITQSLSTSKEVSRLRLQHSMESENLRDIRNFQEKERLNELSLLQVRKENYRISLENWEMSLQNSEAVQMQFNKGYILQTDLLNEQLKIRQSRHRFLQATYDLFNSLISIN